MGCKHRWTGVVTANLLQSITDYFAAVDTNKRAVNLASDPATDPVKEAPRRGKVK
jgi:hypothetical protein